MTDSHSNSPAPSQSKGIMGAVLKAGALVSLGIMLGRIAGLVRESVVAATYGLSADADTVILMLTVPDILVNILIGGGLSAALIPEFKRLGAEDRKALFLQASMVVMVAFSLLAALLAWQSAWVVRAFAPGITGAVARSAAGGLSRVLWLIPLTTLAGVSTAYLQAGNRFGVAAQGTWIFNLTVIAGLFLAVGPSGSLEAIAWFVIAGGLLRWASQLLRIFHTGGLPRFRQGFRRSHSWHGSGLITRYLEATAAAGVLLMLPVTVRAMATLWEEGSLASVNYALKMVDFPLGAAISVMAVVLFPRLSELHIDSINREAYLRVFREGVLWVLVLSLAALLPMWWFRREFIALAFGWGVMSDTALTRVSFLLGISLISLPFMGLSNLFTAAFNSFRDTRTPLYINLAGLALVLGGSWVGGIYYGLPGVLGGLVAGYMLITILQSVLLYLRHGIVVGRILFGRQAAKITAVAIAVVFPVGWVFGNGQLGPLGGVSMAFGLAIAIVLTVIATTPEYRRYGVRLLRQRWK